MQTSRDVVVIGCGGIGSYLVPQLTKLTAFQPQLNGVKITLVDKDTLEHGNLDRQLFPAGAVGRNKAEVLAEQNKDTHPLIEVKMEWFHEQLEWLPKDAIYFGCADNHPARASILKAVDSMGGRCYIGGNGYTDADGYFYYGRWEGQGADPRVWDPTLLTDKSDNPIAASGGCTGDAVKADPQLCLSNARAAAHMLQLFWFWEMESHKLDQDARGMAPVRISSTATRTITETLNAMNERKNNGNGNSN